MTLVFKDMPYVCMYLDELLMCSQTEEEHEQHLQQVFEALCINSMFASHLKTKLFQHQVEYLGH
ncbi:hypothetical protein LPJ66_003187, partial [Kickxella alabastrina]